MLIKNLFERDIFRPINGVVKADQIDDSSVDAFGLVSTGNTGDGWQRGFEDIRHRIKFRCQGSDEGWI